MSLDDFLDRDYKAGVYDCSNFVAEVWQHLTGEDISGICKSWINRDSSVCISEARKRTKLRKPESPCIVLMQTRLSLPHVGIYYQEKILHLATSGVCYSTILILKITHRLSYYK